MIALVFLQNKDRLVEPDDRKVKLENNFKSVKLQPKKCIAAIITWLIINRKKILDLLSLLLEQIFGQLYSL
jgi:hypothetical protein